VAANRSTLGDNHAYLWHHSNDFSQDTELHHRYLSCHRRDMGNCTQLAFLIGCPAITRPDGVRVLQERNKRNLCTKLVSV
jgi:hypothetical protein